MKLDVGGIEFTACPFNGWYMGTEVGRDLADVNRYNKLPVIYLLFYFNLFDFLISNLKKKIIAKKMELDTSTNMSLWKDKALIELNYAILESFRVNMFFKTKSIIYYSLIQIKKNRMPESQLLIIIQHLNHL